MTYKQAGVDVDAGNEVVRRIRKFAKGIGFFGGLYPLGKNFIVGAADGVGTKLKLAFLMNRHETVGIDLVAMNVDDVVATGAKPLFFLDYIGCHKVHLPTIEKIIRGIAEGCKKAECQLLGGETAELSDMYQQGEYDLAGFAVGLVEKGKVINGSKIKAGDKIIGLASSGLHSNGYTLARKILLDHSKLNPKEKVEDFDRTLGEELLTPTKIYCTTILKLIRRCKVKGIAHITGGGIPENLARVLPRSVQAVIELNSWPIHQIFKLIQKLGKVEQNEMYRTFNMGIGMIVVVDGKDVNRAMNFLKKQKEKAYLMGEIEKGKGEVIII
ncbi:MAG: phosphoribosylformylglycinamidine cyclo-ligase [Candidatus Margulisbacteria bacterium]|nr:phosphoribosylformylglycinamidine cyclo-ligase [Candidatus Margulisiibacteriota bacterium]